MVAWWLDEVQLRSWAITILGDVKCGWGLLCLEAEEGIYLFPFFRRSQFSWTVSGIMFFCGLAMD